MRWFRPNIASLLVISVIIGFFLKMVDPQAFFGFATGIIIYWYKSRDEEKRNGTNRG